MVKKKKGGKSKESNVHQPKNKVIVVQDVSAVASQQQSNTDPASSADATSVSGDPSAGAPLSIGRGTSASSSAAMTLKSPVGRVDAAGVVVSGWPSYDECEPAPDEDYIIGDTFQELMERANPTCAYFRLSSERAWMEDGDSSNALRLDLDRLASVLRNVSLHQRLELDEEVCEEAQASFSMIQVHDDETELLRGPAVSESAESDDGCAVDRVHKAANSNSGVSGVDENLAHLSLSNISARISQSTISEQKLKSDTTKGLENDMEKVGEILTDSTSVNAASLLDDNWLDSVLSDED